MPKGLWRRWLGGLGLNELRIVDSEVYAIVRDELERQRHTLELIASENFTSPAVMEAAATPLTNKYAEGYPGRRYYGGCVHVDRVEELARQRACQLFGAEHANVQPHSGSQANAAAYLAFLRPGDKVLGMNLTHGGHLTHGSPVNWSGQIYQFVAYGVDKESEQIDYGALRSLAEREQPKMIVAGASAYPRTLDFDAFREIADAVGAILMVDMAHIAGLVAAGLHPSPVGVADVVTSTTHKTLRGPRGGFILCDKDKAAAIDKAVFPGVQGGPLMHIIAAKAVAFGEALSPQFKGYQAQILANAKALASGLKERGWRLVAGGTDNHLLLVDVGARGLTGKQAEATLDQVGITVNKNTIPFDKLKPAVASGIRIGTAAVTTRGMGTVEMDMIAALIDRALNGGAEMLKEVRQDVATLCERFPLYEQL